MTDRTLRIDSAIYIVPRRVWSQFQTMAKMIATLIRQLELRETRIAQLEAELALRNVSNRD